MGEKSVFTFGCWTVMVHLGCLISSLLAVRVRSAPPWGCNSAGRVSALQAESRWFDSDRPYQATVVKLRQTRCVQGAVRASACGFESRRWHSPPLPQLAEGPP